MKYNEDKALKEIEQYIQSTYSQHYVGKNQLQTIDVWDSLGMAKSMCQGTVLKYIMRYGKKDGYNKKDLFKAIHLIILLMHFSEQDQQQTIEKQLLTETNETHSNK